MSGASVSGQVIRLESADAQFRDAFLRWQCRIRQIAVRQDEGRPSGGMTPEVVLRGEPLGHVVTVMCKRAEFAQTMELKHMAQRTHDAAERRGAAIKFLAERYYQSAAEFSDTMTATFAPASEGAGRIAAAPDCRLRFEQFSQRYELACRARPLGAGHPLREATFWHNQLFNPNLPADCVVLGFEPDWSRSVAEPPPL